MKRKHAFLATLLLLGTVSCRKETSSPTMEMVQVICTDYSPNNLLDIVSAVRFKISRIKDSLTLKYYLKYNYEGQNHIVKLRKIYGRNADVHSFSLDSKDLPNAQEERDVYIEGCGEKLLIELVKTSEIFIVSILT